MNRSFDVVVSVFDSVNYLLDEESLLQMFSEIKKIMNEEAVFIFDFTTPQNSIESIHFLNNREGSTKNGYHYYRKSWYDDKQQIHYNSFEIKKFAPDNKSVMECFIEEHKQRAYTLSEMQKIINKTDFTVQAQYGEFEMQSADETSFRITMVLQ